MIDARDPRTLGEFATLRKWMGRLPRAEEQQLARRIACLPYWLPPLIDPKEAAQFIAPPPSEQEITP
jgi:hypothetical protein